MIHHLTENASYDNNPGGVCPGAYFPTISDSEVVESSRHSNVPCAIIVENPESSSHDNISVLSHEHLATQTKAGSNPSGETPVGNMPSVDSKRKSHLETVTTSKEFDQPCKNRLSVHSGLMLVKTSSLCVIIPSDRTIDGHRDPKNVIRRKCALVIMNPVFDWFITCVIFLNTVFMAVEYYGMSTQLEYVVDVVNLVSEIYCIHIYTLNTNSNRPVSSLSSFNSGGSSFK